MEARDSFPRASVRCQLVVAGRMLRRLGGAKARKTGRKAMSGQSGSSVQPEQEKLPSGGERALHLRECSCKGECPGSGSLLSSGSIQCARVVSIPVSSACFSARCPETVLVLQATHAGPPALVAQFARSSLPPMRAAGSLAFSLLLHQATTT